MSGEDVVALARDWIGTPYVHQASAKGAGTDCLGLLRGLWREMFGSEPAIIPPYSRDWSEPRRDEVLWRAARQYLKEKTFNNLAAGDVLLFRMRDGSVAKHLGVAAEVGAVATFVHAYSAHGVVESPLSDPWRRRIVSCFEFPVRRS